VDVSATKLSEYIQDKIERENRSLRDIRDMNTPAWGMCVGAIEAYESILEWMEEAGSLKKGKSK
jgi:hypothetical protein